ncbi:MAG: potassium channel family protein [Muribaculaceae bacterium]|nr:potassium channel family protein [Muribaculaceae bacterium]
MLRKLSDWFRHFFHVVSNVRPIAWIGLYVLLVPVFAFIYNLLPDGQFRIPDGGTTDFGSWLYYSIVTITTLGFGDYTPMGAGAQAVTAVEVMCGLIFLGFFLNAVGSMKSEIDVRSEIERQRLLHEAAERTKLIGMIPSVINIINQFTSVCERYKKQPNEATRRGLLKKGARVSLCLDGMQNRVDLSQWPELVEGCFTFVADYQLYISTDDDDSVATAHESVDTFVDNVYKTALDIETRLTEISTHPQG